MRVSVLLLPYALACLACLCFPGASRGMPGAIAAGEFKTYIAEVIRGKPAYTIWLGIGDSLQTGVPFEFFDQLHRELPEVGLPWIGGIPDNGYRGVIWYPNYLQVDEASGAERPAEIDAEHTGGSYWPSGEYALLTGEGQRLHYGFGSFASPNGHPATSFAMYHQGQGSFVLEAVAVDSAGRTAYAYPGNPVQATNGALGAEVWDLTSLRPDAGRVKWAFRVTAAAGTSHLEIFPGAWFNQNPAGNELQYARLGDGGNHLSQWLAQPHAAQSLRTILGTLPKGAVSIVSFKEAWEDPRERQGYAADHLLPEEGLPILLDALRGDVPAADVLVMGPHVTATSSTLPQAQSEACRQAALDAGEGVHFLDHFTLLGSWEDMLALDEALSGAPSALNDVHLTPALWRYLAADLWDAMDMGAFIAAQRQGASFSRPPSGMQLLLLNRNP